MTEFDKIRDYLAFTPRNLLLFELAIQTEVPLKNLLGLKMIDIKTLEVGDELPIFSSKNNTTENPLVTAEIYSALKKFIDKTVLLDNEYVFKSQKGNRPLSIQSVSRMLRSWLNETGLIQYRGFPSLRRVQREKREKTNNMSDDNNRNNISILPKIINRSVQETVFIELEKAILSGRIPPGQKIVAEKISKMMDVSRIPVREAMGRLEAKGLILTKSQCGSVVNKLSKDNLVEISQLRLLIEPKAGADAIRRVNDAFLVQLEKAHKAFAIARKGVDAAELIKTNREFHFLIYKQANTPIRLDFIKQLWDKISPYYHIMFGQSLERAPTHGVKYHQKIVDSIKKKDVRGVKHCFKAEINNSAAFILKLFDSYSG